MERANILNSKTGAIWNGDMYVFGNALPGRGQCGEFVNDALGLSGKDRMLDSLASKEDGVDYKRLKNGGYPIAGGYFVMDTKTKFGHVGLISKVSGEHPNRRLWIVDHNWFGNEKRRHTFFDEGDTNWNKIVGFGVGNPIIKTAMDTVSSLLVIIDQNASKSWSLTQDPSIKMWMESIGQAKRKIQEILGLPVTND